MTIVFLLIVVAFAVLIFVENKVKGHHSLLKCVIESVFILVWGIVTLFILNQMKGFFHDFRSTFDCIGAIAIGLCIVLIPSTILQKIIMKNEEKDESDIWKCPKCGQINSLKMKVCDCGTANKSM